MAGTAISMTVASRATAKPDGRRPDTADAELEMSGVDAGIAHYVSLSSADEAAAHIN
ncbi:hypothetical protein [Amycolatopsis sp. CA-126428]|uniref:hypothetical protein n=1 Tax=Amycolatopsis sp. CA-126428 TaxID=2073158 RepID=UPI001304DE05|nr:hypothetical protein [Amycolatopsis sp. CA-126428]